jgi:hypothetical protein
MSSCSRAAAETVHRVTARVLVNSTRTTNTRRSPNAASFAALFLTTAVVIVDRAESNSAPAGAASNTGGVDF